MLYIFGIYFAFFMGKMIPHEIDYINTKTGNIETLYVHANMNNVEMENAVVSWAMRTEKYTEESLCSYINSKGLHSACPSKDYKGE